MESIIMSKQYFKLKKNCILGVFFLISLILTLWVNHSYFVIDKIAFAEVADTSINNGNQRITKGFEYYEQGKLKEAIQNWEQVLKKYQENQQIEKQVVVRTNLAIAYKKLGNSEQQINQWQQIVNLYRQLENPVSTARALTELAQAYSDSGDFTKAINILCGVREKSKNKYKPSCLKGTALEISITQKDIKGEVAGLGSLGEVYRQLAKYDLAIRYLSFAKQKLDFDTENISLKSKILNSLGNVYLGKAKLWSVYTESAFKSRLPKYKKLTEEADSYYQNAQNNFQSSYQIALKQQDKSAQMRALINLIQLNYHNLNFKQNRTVETASNSPAIKDKDNNSNNLYDNANQRKKLIYKALALLDELPESQQKVYAAINLANLSADDKITSPLTQCSTKRKLSDDKILGLLNVAVKTANNLQDSRSKSFALGAAGHFYECQNNYNQALELTYKAILAADYKLQAKDSLYLWKWQQARLLEKTGNQSDAISAYERAFLTLEKIRSDITSSNKDLQLNFRDVIQPLYRKLASLKLEQATTKVSFNQKNILKSGKRNQRNKEFNQALEIIDSLRLAELQNYFGNDCITTAITTQKVDELLGGSEGKTAVISSIFLDDRVAILLDLPDKSQHIEWIEKVNNQKISKQELEAEIINFLTDLRGQQRFRVDDSPEAQKVYKNARKLYDLIIRPFEEKGYLNQEKIQTIVFVQDGLFRSIPMSALIDKNSGKYLIEKYAIATTPSLRLTAPKQNNREINRAMLFGFNEEAEIDGKLFDSLQFVNSEIEALKKLFSSTKILRYEDLIPSDITDIKDKPRKNIFPIIHIATHAQFGFTPEDTFLVMGKNRKLTISELEKFLTGISDNINTLELLTLSACQTATGDERANLGLAGVALETGVKSALASLWAVNDESTSILVREFYQNLRAGETKARALQQAQIALIRNTNQTPGIREEYSKPYYWSPFIMIGNWL